MGPAPGLVDGFDVFCQVGENAGKPGPCPEGGHDQPSRPRGVTGHITPEEGQRHVAAYQAAKALAQNPGESHGDFTRRRTAALRQTYAAVPSPAVKTPDVRSDLEAKHLGGDRWVLALNGTPFLAGTTTGHVRAQFPGFRVPGLDPPEPPERQARREANSLLLAEKLPASAAGLRRLVVVSAPPGESDEGHPVAGTLSARDHADLESVADYLAPLGPGKYLFSAPAGKDARSVAKEIRDYHTGAAKPLSADMDSLWEALADPGRRVRAQNAYGWAAVKKISNTHSLVYTPGREAPYAVAPSAKLPKAGDADTFADAPCSCGDCPGCVPSPDGWDAFADKTGFTGEKKDSLGRRICYQGGRRVSPADFDSFADSGPCKPGERSDLTGCVPAEGGGGQQPAGHPGNTPAPSSTKAKFGKSKAKVYLNYGASKVKVDAALKKMFGKKAPSVEDLASAVGAPDDATVGVSVGKVEGKEVVEIMMVKHDHFTAKRHIFKNGSGVHMKNDEFWVNPAAQGKGVGSDVFGRQVEQCQELGINSIRCHAAKENPQDPSKPHNGYYTWPRFGYDSEIPRPGEPNTAFDDFALAALHHAFPDAGTLLEVMATPDGREWWKRNGSDAYKMVFDLTPGSRSLAVWEAYQQERQKKGS